MPNNPQHPKQRGTAEFLFFSTVLLNTPLSPAPAGVSALVDSLYTLRL